MIVSRISCSSATQQFCMETSSRMSISRGGCRRRPYVPGGHRAQNRCCQTVPPCRASNPGWSIPNLIRMRPCVTDAAHCNAYSSYVRTHLEKESPVAHVGFGPDLQHGGLHQAGRMTENPFEPCEQRGIVQGPFRHATLVPARSSVPTCMRSDVSSLLSSMLISAMVAVQGVQDSVVPACALLSHECRCQCYMRCYACHHGMSELIAIVNTRATAW